MPRVDPTFRDHDYVDLSLNGLKQVYQTFDTVTRTGTRQTGKTVHFPKMQCLRGHRTGKSRNKIYQNGIWEGLIRVRVEVVE